MLFSIITVTYNSRIFLSETIHSVLSQDCTDFEYILIDGGSSDGTLDVIKHFEREDSRIRWISEPDDGISDAFNKGIRMATGDIIGILNSDDIYADGALSAVAAAFGADGRCDVVHGDMVRFQGDIPLFRLKPAPVDERIWYDMPVNHPATFVRRTAYGLVGLFDTSLKVAMDYDLVLRLYRAGCRFQYLDRVLAHMRYGGASDERFLAARREVFAVTVAAGYPRWRAGWWFVVKACMNITKNLLRRLGLHGIIRLHPKFKKHQGES
ncbi:MAG: glycosyltransferase family 2 protein [Desulfuromonadaceae bacterium]|nr:glycosyltransferase family 2 protein [Desulfuromonadaceae bacterium]